MNKDKEARSISHGVSIPETYRHALSCGLAVVEEMLSDISLVVKKAIARQLSSSGNSPNAHLRAVEEEIQNMQDDVVQMRSELKLGRSSENLGGTILSRCAKVWETLHNLKPARLRGYGAAPPELSAYLDSRINTMLARVDRILDESKMLAHESSQQSVGGDSKNRAEHDSVCRTPHG